MEASFDTSGNGIGNGHPITQEKCERTCRINVEQRRLINKIEELKQAGNLQYLVCATVGGTWLLMMERVGSRADESKCKQQDTAHKSQVNYQNCDTGNFNGSSVQSMK